MVWIRVTTKFRNMVRLRMGINGIVLMCFSSWRGGELSSTIM